MEREAWYGPLFLVGLPRSGTKLLRGILNNHPKIYIADIETQFLPVWISEWDRYGDLSNYNAFRKFYKTQLWLPYFQYKRERGCMIDAEKWYKACNNYTVAGVFEALIRHDANVKCVSSVIWGDKSPSYVRYISPIAGAFPNAKFIHIIRDVRDYCLSMEKAWGKNKNRAAQRWVDEIDDARHNGSTIPKRYLETRFEDLLTDPEAEVAKMCRFLGVDFDASIIELGKPSENVGDAAGKTFIVRDNKSKYTWGMTPEERFTIECIAGKLLKELGYRVEARIHERRLSKGEMRILQILDGVNVFRFNLKRRRATVAARHWFGGLLLKIRRRGKARDK